MPHDAIRAVAELAASQHRAFTRRQAAALNFDRSRVATAIRLGWLDEPYPGVLVMAGGCRESWPSRLMAATLADGGHAVASHRAAARLHRLDGFDDCDILELSITRGHRWQRKNDVIAHHVSALERCDVVAIDGIRCTGLARTLADLGAVVPPLLVRRALTDARRRGTSLRWIQQTVDRLHRPGPAGTGVLLRQLATIPFEGRVPDSWFEELLALCLDDPEVPPLVLQHPIRDDDGWVVAKTDIGFPSVRLGLEAHSRRFHFGPDAEPLDRATRSGGRGVWLAAPLPRLVRDPAPTRGAVHRQADHRRPETRTVSQAGSHPRGALTIPPTGGWCTALRPGRRRRRRSARCRW